MVSLHKRLEKLEARHGGPPKAGGASPRLWERYFHAHENARRELQGLEPLPDLPYTEEDHENDRRFLEGIVPAYRAGPGWQTEEAQAVLDYWQQQTEERLQAGD